MAFSVGWSYLRFWWGPGHYFCSLPGWCNASVLARVPSFSSMVIEFLYNLRLWISSSEKGRFRNFLSCLLSFFPCFCYMHTSSLLGRSHQRRDSGLEPTSLQLVQPYSYLLKMWGFWVKRSLDYFHSKHRRFGDDWTNGFLNSFYISWLRLLYKILQSSGFNNRTLLSHYSGD